LKNRGGCRNTGTTLLREDVRANHKEKEAKEKRAWGAGVQRHHNLRGVHCSVRKRWLAGPEEETSRFKTIKRNSW